MKNIQTFEGFFTNIKNIFRNPKTKYTSELNKYSLKLSYKDKHSFDIKHSGRLVGEILLSDEESSYPIWILNVYYYDSEIKNVDKKPSTKIVDQDEPYYAKSSKKYRVDSDDALKSFINWWSSNTKSGRLKNPLYKAKSGTNL